MYLGRAAPASCSFSDWRRDRDLEHLREELAAASVECALLGSTRVLGGQARWREIEAWMNEHDVDARSVVIVDDGDVGPFQHRFVRTSHAKFCGSSA
jgi:hypothetical protein